MAPAVMVAAMVVSTAISAASAISQGIQQGDIADQNEAAARRNAGAALSSGEAEAARTERNTRRQLATAENTFGAAGIDPGSGSALDAQADMAAEGSLDSQIQRWRGRQQANSYLDQANVYSMQAGSAPIAGAMTGAATLIGGAAKAGYAYSGGGTGRGY
ncbi:MAG: hypothetical protein P4L83_21190 [Nevskia sp.]|nr:hypothetical protein [Nevskia sp.]